MMPILEMDHIVFPHAVLQEKTNIKFCKITYFVILSARLSEGILWAVRTGSITSIKK